jgi:hypothetical protein
MWKIDPKDTLLYETQGKEKRTTDLQQYSKI